jgi:sec-independent protein translocase protein TatB
MFNIGFEELIVILLVAFVIVGPKDLPKVARALGRFVKTIKQMYADFKEETGLDEAIDEFQDASRDIGNTLRDADPRRELRSAQRDAQKAIKEAEKEVKSE